MWSQQEIERYLMRLVCDEQIPVHYGDLYVLAGVRADDIGSRNYFHNLLGEISSRHYERGLPMLSVIVITQEGQPGPGFFNLARQLNSGYVGFSNEQIFVTEFRAVQANTDTYRDLLAANTPFDI